MLEPPGKSGRFRCRRCVDGPLQCRNNAGRPLRPRGAPENFGGGTGPVLGDAYIEKTLSVVPGYSRVFKVHYKITHFGADTHANSTQELPVMYVNPNVPNFVYYSGAAPWTNGALAQIAMPATCCRIVSTTEQWGACVDASNTGIALYTPMQYPDSKGFNAGSTLQFSKRRPEAVWRPV